MYRKIVTERARSRYLEKIDRDIENHLFASLSSDFRKVVLFLELELIKDEK